MKNTINLKEQRKLAAECQHTTEAPYQLTRHPVLSLHVKKKKRKKKEKGRVSNNLQALTGI